MDSPLCEAEGLLNDGFVERSSNVGPHGFHMGLVWSLCCCTLLVLTSRLIYHRCQPREPAEVIYVNDEIEVSEERVSADGRSEGSEATYFLPGCDGRGAWLGVESSSVGAGGGGGGGGSGGQKKVC